MYVLDVNQIRLRNGSGQGRDGKWQVGLAQTAKRDRLGKQNEGERGAW